MSQLIYIMNASLDGYIEDASGAIDWADPDQIFGFITEMLRPIGTYLYGRRIYETMAYWDQPIESYSEEEREFVRVWQQAEKIVFSRTLSGAGAHNSRLERTFDPAAIAGLKRDSKHDIAIAGAQLAGLAFDADLVDACHLFIHPVIVGGGKPALQTAARRNLELLDTRRFSTGVVHLHYRVRR